MLPIKADDSMWTLEDRELHLSLEKAQRGQPWPCVFEGHGEEGAAQEEDRRRLMLEVRRVSCAGERRGHGYPLKVAFCWGEEERTQITSEGVIILGAEWR